MSLSLLLGGFLGAEYGGGGAMFKTEQPQKPDYTEAQQLL